jgi:hypothetical protein
MIILLYFAFVFFVIGTFWYPGPPPQVWYGRFNLVSAGLACWVGSIIFGHHIG